MSKCMCFKDWVKSKIKAMDEKYAGTVRGVETFNPITDPQGTLHLPDGDGYVTIQLPPDYTEAMNEMLIVTPVPFEAEEAKVSYRQTTKGNGELIVSGPIASREQAGFVLPIDLRKIDDNSRRIQALEASGTAGGLYVVNADFSALDDEERTAVLEEVKGSAAIPGDCALDDTGKYWVYTLSGWGSANTVLISTPNGSVVVSSNVMGQCYLESNLTLSVNGWDQVNDRIEYNTEAIDYALGQIESFNDSVAALYAQMQALNATKLNKYQGTANAGKWLKVGTDGNIVPGTLPSADPPFNHGRRFSWTVTEGGSADKLIAKYNVSGREYVLRFNCWANWTSGRVAFTATLNGAFIPSYFRLRYNVNSNSDGSYQLVTGTSAEAGLPYSGNIYDPCGEITVVGDSTSMYYEIPPIKYRVWGSGSIGGVLYAVVYLPPGWTELTVL